VPLRILTGIMRKIVGIDLGTTNRRAVMEGGEPHVIPNAEGSRRLLLVPSRDGERWSVRLPAPGHSQSAETIYSIKRFMGRKFSEIAEERKVPTRSGGRPDGWP